MRRLRSLSRFSLASVVSVVAGTALVACPGGGPGSDAGSPEPEPDFYENVEELGTAMLEAEQDRGVDTWLDVTEVELPSWAPAAAAPWGERVQEMLDQLNGIHEAVVPGEVPEAEDGQLGAQAVIRQALSSCSEYEGGCEDPVIANTYSCEYRASCGSASIRWTYLYSPGAIVDEVTYFGSDGKWDYGSEAEGGFMVQAGTRTFDGKSFTFTSFTNPDNPGIFSRYVWAIDGEATVYTPWGGETHVFTVSTVSTIFLYDGVMEAYRPSLEIAMERTVPNGPLTFINSHWSFNQEAMVVSYTVTFADGGCAWASFEDDGTLKDSGTC